MIFVQTFFFITLSNIWECQMIWANPFIFSIVIKGIWATRIFIWCRLMNCLPLLTAEESYSKARVCSPQKQCGLYSELWAFCIADQLVATDETAKPTDSWWPSASSPHLCRWSSVWRFGWLHSPTVYKESCGEMTRAKASAHSCFDVFSFAWAAWLMELWWVERNGRWSIVGSSSRNEVYKSRHLLFLTFLRVQIDIWSVNRIEKSVVLYRHNQ